MLITVTIALLVGQNSSPPLATPAEKKAFLEVLKGLPARGEFYTEEAVNKAVPHTLALLALTEEDIEDYGLYPFLALSAGLSSHKNARELAVIHFERIAHPSIQINWAIMLMCDPKIQPIIVRHLKKAIDAPKGAKTLAAVRDPRFAGLKDEVEAILEKTRRVSVELVKKHAIDELPVSWLGYSSIKLCNNRIYSLREANGHGELTITNWRTNERKSRVVPQPAGVKVEPDRGVDAPLLEVNSAGDIVCTWMIGGNGDHAIAVCKADAESFQVVRVKQYLMGALIFDDGARGWLLVQGGTVYRIGDDANLTKVATCDWHSAYHALDARMIAPGLLHGFWQERGEGLHMRCADYDFSRKLWLHPRVIQRIDEFVSSANRPMVLQTDDKRLHYVWRVDPGNQKRPFGGIYYHSELHGTTDKIADGFQFRAVVSRDRVVVCMTNEETPEKIFFRVVNNGVAHPPIALAIGPGRKYGLWSEDMLFAAEGERIYFLDKLNRKTVYELRLVDASEVGGH